MKLNNKSDLDKCKTMLYYDLFWMLYNESYIHVGIGGVWLQRIKDQHYKYGSVKRLCVIIDWFKNNYDTTQYTANILAWDGSGFAVDIRDKNSNLLEWCKFAMKNGKYQPIKHEFFNTDTDRFSECKEVDVSCYRQYSQFDDFNISLSH